MDVRRAFITGDKYSRSQTFEKSHQNETVLILPVDLSSLPSSFDLEACLGNPALSHDRFWRPSQNGFFHKIAIENRSTNSETQERTRPEHLLYLASPQ